MNKKIRKFIKLFNELSNISDKGKIKIKQVLPFVSKKELKKLP